ncbi:MAG: bifunctional diaminohydroxyphosphoribosylaminopyrimidine deaminase/5-amino-6-(5-phosphoribosylamino)uracil reductase RibD [bacterium]|nr:bifunctional diaminohydroxyphosphoribosylaminopyrimidine deaminase/5-amino-6-(5-phosphoribosylamino)uracil reductase RibD [bacterium]
MPINYIQETIKLAKLGGKTSPNPMVGAVIVKNGKIIGKGYHKGKGTPHAEVVAIQNVKSSVKGAILYVNLEPCCHWGTTPPCTKAIIEAGIKEVHTSIIDPAKWVNGKGVRELKQAGIKVLIGECAKEAEKLNETYLKYMRTGLPFVIMKAAITLDGKIAGDTKTKEWISNPKTRAFVHQLRARVDAILVGSTTVNYDNPELTVRLVKGKNPKKIILSSNLSIPRNAKILGDNCIIATTNKNKSIPGTEIWRFSGNKVDLLTLLQKSAENNIQSILIEGGQEVFTQALSGKIVDKVYFIIAPKLIGNGLQVIGNLGIKQIKDSIHLNYIRFRTFDDNMVLEGYI